MRGKRRRRRRGEEIYYAIEGRNLIIVVCAYHCFSHHVKEDGERQKYRDSCKERKAEWIITVAERRG
jgi:hypothetical protein